MNYIIINVPDMNDSESRVVLSGTPYFIRFSYNDTGDFWKFSLYTSQREPVVVGIKIVPRFPLNLFCGITRLPDGVFGAFSGNERIGREDFKNGSAQFVFCPARR